MSLDPTAPPVDPGLPFTPVPSKAIDLIPKIGSTAYAVLGVICRRAGTEGACVLTFQQIAQALGITTKTVSGSVSRLRQEGLVTLTNEEAKLNATSPAEYNL